MHAIELAAEGDEIARKVVRANVASDVVERVMKVRHVVQAELEVSKNNVIHQFGQPMEKARRIVGCSQHRYGRWQKGSEAQTNNAFRLKERYITGELHDHSFVEISMAADNMSDQAMQDEGFFTDTMSCVIRFTTIKDGILTVESAFVAGVKELGAERHDRATILKMAAALGVDLSEKTAADIIDTPLLIHNSAIPDGVINLVQLYDQCAGDTFFSGRPIMAVLKRTKTISTSLLNPKTVHVILKEQ